MADYPHCYCRDKNRNIDIMYIILFFFSGSRIQSEYTPSHDHEKHWKNQVLACYIQMALLYISKILKLVKY